MLARENLLQLRTAKWLLVVDIMMSGSERNYALLRFSINDHRPESNGHVVHLLRIHWNVLLLGALILIEHGYPVRITLNYVQQVPGS